MSEECIFCGSDNTFWEFDDVIRCKDCWRIEVRSGSMTEEKYEGGHRFDGPEEYCFEHVFVDTGTKRSWCKKCDVDGIFDIERGEYFTHDDLETFQRLAAINAGGNPK